MACRSRRKVLWRTLRFPATGTFSVSSISSDALRQVRRSVGHEPVSLFGLDARCLDDRPPLVDLGLVEGVKRFWSLLVGREYLLADVGEPLPYRWVGERGRHRGVELDHDLLRRALGHPQPVPE